MTAQANAPETSIVLSIECDGGRLHIKVHDGETPDGPVVAEQDFPASVNSMAAAAWCVGVLESLHERAVAEAR